MVCLSTAEYKYVLQRQGIIVIITITKYELLPLQYYQNVNYDYDYFFQKSTATRQNIFKTIQFLFFQPRLLVIFSMYYFGKFHIVLNFVFPA